MNNKGFTLMETAIVLVVIGLITVMGLPLIKDSVEKQNRLAMRGALVGYMALARNAAVSRGCRSAVHFVSGANSRLWVTACSTRPGAAAGERDTLAGPIWTEDRWNHRFQSGRDSISYDSRGLRQTLVASTILIRTKGDQTKDSVAVNAVGKVTYP